MDVAQTKQSQRYIMTACRIINGLRQKSTPQAYAVWPPNEVILSDEYRYVLYSVRYRYVLYFVRYERNSNERQGKPVE